MKFLSTRGLRGASLEEALFAGYAADGGLFMPEEIPQISDAEFTTWRSLSYGELCAAVLAKFTGDEVPFEDLQRICTDTFAQWSVGEVVPVVPVKGALVAELFHGPSLSFKDFGLQLLCRLLDYFAARARRRVALLVATTGDTGPAAIEVVNSCPRMGLTVAFPAGQISELQERQIACRAGDRVRAIRFEGGGDDMDLPIKSLVTDQDFKRRHGLTSVNSINLGRVLAQTAHYVWSFLRATEANHEEVTFVVPTGAMGNLAAGSLARAMGVPIHSFVAATNDNDITHRVIATGLFHRRPMKRTLSEAINIQVPYNFERVLYILTRDQDQVAQWYKGMEATGQIDLEGDLLDEIQLIFKSQRVSDSRMLATIRDYHRLGYLADPHTAVALAALDDARGPRPIVLATAHPCKFKEALVQALGETFWADYLPSLPALVHTLYASPLPRILEFRTGGNPLAVAQSTWELELRRLMDQSASSKL